jgi:hypothetical protein
MGVACTVPVHLYLRSSLHPGYSILGVDFFLFRTVTVTVKTATITL